MDDIGSKVEPVKPVVPYEKKAQAPIKPQPEKQDGAGRYGLKHPDGSPCDAKTPESCPLNKQKKQQQEQNHLQSNLTDVQKMDAEYLNAIRRGDMETCSRLIRNAVAKAMPNTKVIGEDGLPKLVSHVSPSPIKVFDHKRIGTHGSHAGPGFYFMNGDISKNGYLHRYGDFGTNAFINITNPILTDEHGKTSRSITKEQISTLVRQFALFGNDESKISDVVDAIHHGLNVTPNGDHVATSSTIADDLGVINALFRSQQERWGGEQNAVFADMVRYITGFDGTMNVAGGPVAFINSQIKSADPVTYDDNGQPIPLSKRFDFNNPDIRY